MSEGTVYIAGPMTGIEHFNRPAFYKVASSLTRSGYNVLNPATLPPGLSQAQYMSICLPMVLCSDSLFMLKNWRESEGALAEHALAVKLKLRISYEF